MPRYLQTQRMKRRSEPEYDRATKRSKYARQMVIRRQPINRNLTPINFRRRFYYAGFTWSTASVTGFWNVLQMSFNQIPNSTDYADLFQEYKINRIKVTFVPCYTGSDQTGVAAGASVPMLHYKVETPQFLTPAGAYNNSTLNAYMDTGPTSKLFDKPISVYFEPTIPTDVNNTVVETQGPSWIRTTVGGTAILHNGLSFFINFNSFSSPSATFTTDVYYEFYFQTRNPA